MRSGRARPSATSAALRAVGEDELLLEVDRLEIAVGAGRLQADLAEAADDMVGGALIARGSGQPALHTVGGEDRDVAPPARGAVGGGGRRLAVVAQAASRRARTDGSRIRIEGLRTWRRRTRRPASPCVIHVRVWTACPAEEGLSQCQPLHQPTAHGCCAAGSGSRHAPGMPTRLHPPPRTGEDLRQCRPLPRAPMSRPSCLPGTTIECRGQSIPAHFPLPEQARGG